MNRYVCQAAQPGFAAEFAFFYRQEKAGAYQRADAAAEAARLDEAVSALSGRLTEKRDAAQPAEAALFEAEVMILRDEDFTGYARRLIDGEGADAPSALRQAADRLCGMLADSGSDYIQARCEDVRGLAAELTALLTGSETALPQAPCILAAETLSPAQLALVEPKLIRGILTETGSPTSHVSVMAGNLGVPYLYGVENLAEKVRSRDFLILDGEDASVCVNPPEDEILAARARQEAAAEARAAQPTRTKVFANISGTEDPADLLRAGADGIGLFRSEFLFLNRADAPSEEEQFAAYRRIAEGMQGRETVIRTMDIGSDKQAEWLDIPAEINPALGLRGLRVSLANRAVFRTQLRALLRAAACGNIRVMVPMVTAVWEVDEVLAEIRAAAAELDSRSQAYRIPPLGVMIETPAAVMIAPELASKVQFFSIGTNDLTQYALALDREARSLERYADPLHEAVFRLIALTVEAAHARRIPVAVCGELASHPQAVARLVQLGVDELSVSAAKIPHVRQWASEAEAKQPAAPPAASEEGVHAPADGELVPMADIPDPVFSGGMMGECVGIIPADGKIYAPVSGAVATVARTGHALSFRRQDEEILVHVGLDTVKMNGEGFTVRVRVGEEVTQGQLVMEADISLIRARGFNPIVICCRVPHP